MNLLSELSHDNVDVEIISEEQYQQLDEAAQRAYRRVGNSITQYYRCTSGPKKGKLASDPSKCGQRKDPQRVRHGRKVAQRKGSIRVRKTQARKRTQLSKRVTTLNATLRNRNSKQTSESFIDHLNANRLCEQLSEVPEDRLANLINELERGIEWIDRKLDEHKLHDLFTESESEVTQVNRILDIGYTINENDASFAVTVEFVHGENITSNIEVSFKNEEPKVTNLNVV